MSQETFGGRYPSYTCKENQSYSPCQGILRKCRAKSKALWILLFSPVVGITDSVSYVSITKICQTSCSLTRGLEACQESLELLHYLFTSVVWDSEAPWEPLGERGHSSGFRSRSPGFERPPGAYQWNSYLALSLVSS